MLIQIHVPVLHTGKDMTAQLVSNNNFKNTNKTKFPSLK